MPLIEIKRSSIREVPPETNPVAKKIPIKSNISEIGDTRKVETPVSWDSGCRL